MPRPSYQQRVAKAIAEHPTGRFTVLEIAGAIHSRTNKKVMSVREVNQFIASSGLVTRTGTRLVPLPAGGSCRYVEYQRKVL